MAIKSYWDQLLHMAGDEYEMKLAFIGAGISTSVFYRARRGTDLSYKVAKKVEAGILARAA